MYKIEKKLINSFVTNSNKIEGASVQPDSLEFINHFKAVRWMLKYPGDKPVGSSTILELHRRLMHGIMYDAGQLRTCEIMIAGHRGIPSVLLNEEMEKLEQGIQKCAGDENEIWNLHHKFEVIHPFSDGNGRVGRMLLNLLRLRAGLTFLIVFYDKRQEYYDMIENYRGINDGQMRFYDKN